MTRRSAMTSRQRLNAAINGEPVDRPPVSLWRHFPERDQTVDDLAGETLAWQRRFGFDLVKFMPPGDYPTIDWGAESRYEGVPGGTRTTYRFPVSDPASWRRLGPVDVRAGFNGVILDALAATRRELDPDVPLFQTIFSPLTIAQKLSNGQAVAHSLTHPAALREGLATITRVTRAMVKASYAAGADGIFFATQCADRAVMDEAGYEAFGLSYDLQVLEATRGSGILMVHTHGEAPMFELALRYNADILNWHDRRASPGLAAGQRQRGRAVAGGLNEREIATMSPEQAAAQARDAIDQTGGRHLIVAPGCVIPVATPDATIRAVTAAVSARSSPLG